MTYSYRCSEHGRYVIEASIHDDLTINPPRCPECDSVMSKVYTAPVISFKGSGWGHQ